TLSVDSQRYGSAAAQRFVEHEIESREIRQLESLNLASDKSAEERAHTFDGYLARKDRIPALLERDHADIGDVALVARPRVGNTRQRDVHAITSTCGVTNSRGMSAGQKATTSRTCGRPSPYPVAVGGPVSTSGTISRVKRSTASRSCPRTPIR